MFKRLNLHNLIQYTLVLALLTPLVFTPFTLYPTYYGKTMVFQLLVEIALLLYLILVLRGEVKGIKTGYIFWLVVLYLGIRTITGLFGINPEKSFWGTQGRMGGNFTWLHLLAFFFLLIQLFKEKKEWYRLIKITVFVSFLVALTGIFQRFGIVPPGGWWPPEIGGRIYGVIGNSIPFANYILFSTFFAFLIFYQSLKKMFTEHLSNKKLNFLLPVLGWGTILATNVLALFWSGTRGVIYVFVLSIPFMIILFGISSKKKYVRMIFIILALFCIAGSVLVWFKGGSEFILGIDTVQTRLMNWQIALKGWTETTGSFLVGHGTENYDRIFDKYYNPEFLKYSFYETVGDKPHNILLEVANASGILGLFSYLSIFFGVMVFLVSRVQKNKISRTSVIILSLAFLTYLGQNMAEFDSNNVLILFFLALGFVSSFSLVNKIKYTSAKLFIIPFILVCSFGWLGTIQPVLSSYYTAKSKEFIYEDVERWGEYAKKALESPSIFHDEIRIHIANGAFYVDARGLFNISQQNFDALKILHEKLGESTKKHPGAYEYTHRFAQIESMMGEYVDRRYFNDAEKTFQELDLENPNRQAVGLAWGQMRLVKGDVSGAVEVLQKVVDRNPESDNVRWYLGLVLLEAGERERGIKELEKSITMGIYATRDTSNIDLVVNLWEEDEKYDEIISFYARLVAFYRKSVTYSEESVSLLKMLYPRLAATYAKVGDIEKAIEATEQAVALDPGLINEARDFIESLRDK